MPGFDLDGFRARGFARVAGAIDEPVVAAMRARVWSVLAGRGIDADDPGSWPAGTVDGLRALRVGDEDPDRAGPVRAALDAVFGPVERSTPRHWGQALVAFPREGPWSVPRRGWHCDFPFWFAADEIWGAIAFLFLDDVDPGGGATLVLDGSPGLVRRAIAGRDDLATAKPTAVIADALARVPALTSAADDELLAGVESSDGTTLRVVEMTGRAGDVVICHPWLLHCAGANTSSRPRLQRAARFQRRFRHPGS